MAVSLWNPLSRQRYFAYLAETWGSWSKNEPSEISKGDQKRIQCVNFAILFQINTT